MRELVSIIIPAYNAGAHLKACLDSVLSQTYRNTEVIVVNDGSSDDTLSIANSYTDDRIKIISNQSNQGLAACVNLAIRKSTGAFIARMDSDDIAYPQRLTKQVRFLESNKDVHVLGTGMRGFGYSHYTHEFPGAHDACKARLLFNVCFGHPTVVFRRSVFESGEYFYNEALKQYSEEYELWCRMVDKFKFANLPEVLLAYRTVSPSAKNEAQQLRRENSFDIRSKLLTDQLHVSSQEDFNRHDKVANLDRASDAEQLILWEGWLDELLRRSKDYQAFDEAALLKEVNNVRMELYYWNTQLGMKAWRRASRFSRSDIHDQFTFRAKHLFKSLIRR